MLDFSARSKWSEVCLVSGERIYCGLNHDVARTGCAFARVEVRLYIHVFMLILTIGLADWST